MIDGKDMFESKEKVVGYLESSAGGVLLTDGGWEEDLPLTTQESVALDLNIEPGKIPVIAVRKNNKRFIILAIDDAVQQSFLKDLVETTDQVVIPKEEKTEEKPTEEETE